MNIITIKISGKVQIGKSATLASIRKLLLENDYCVAIPERCESKNPSEDFDNAAPHEIPTYDDTVFILVEETER